MVKNEIGNKDFNFENRIDRTPRQRATGSSIKSTLLIGENPRGTTTNKRFAYGTLYSVYRFKFKRNGKSYITDRFVGTATTNRQQNVAMNYPELIRGAYLNAVFQFRETYNVGSKGYSAIHEKSVFYYYQEGRPMPEKNKTITNTDITQYNSETINVFENVSRKQRIDKLIKENKHPPLPTTKRKEKEHTEEFLKQARKVQRKQRKKEK